MKPKRSGRRLLIAGMLIGAMAPALRLLAGPPMIVDVILLAVFLIFALLFYLGIGFKKEPQAGPGAPEKAP